MLDAQELSFVTSHLDFWEKLDGPERQTLELSCSKTEYAAGESLRSRDSECLGVLVVHTGELRAYIVSEDGREVTLYRLGPGEVCVLSASCVLNSLTFDVLIGADAPTEVFRINLGAFDKLMKQNVWVENFAYKSAVERFSDVMWAVEQILFMRFDKRLAIFLLDESAREESGEIRLTHDQIAKYTGSAREVVSRMLKSFNAQGMLEFSRGSIRVTNREKLKKLL